MTEPQTLAELLTYLAPPMELLSYLDRAIERQGDKTPERILVWREKWRRINAGEAYPEIDKFDSKV